MQLMSVGWHVCFVINYFVSQLILKKYQYGYNNDYCLTVSEKKNMSLKWLWVQCKALLLGTDLAANGLVPLCTL